MKLTKQLAVLCVVGFSMHSAYADQSAFTGLYGSLSSGYENNTFKNAPLTIGNSQLGSATSSGAGSNSFGSAPLIIGLGYTFQIRDKITLGLGADYSFNFNQTTGTVSGAFPNQVGNNSWNYQISNRYSIFLAPGYDLAKDKLVYAKVGYSNQSISASASNQTLNGQSLGSASVGGYVLGLGYKQVLNGGFYGFGEANYYSYSSANLSSSVSSGGATFNSSLNPQTNAYNLLLGVGYKF
jgi:hypothetical protein